MFTGLIREVGTLQRLARGRQTAQLQIRAPELADVVGPGDSVAVDGICLTATEVRRDLITVTAAVETLRVTTLRSWRRGRRVHLEPALRAGQPLDGHLVLGHVDGTGRIASIRQRGDSRLVTVVCGERLGAWLLPKGSVAVDGVSLTVDEGPHADRFTVNLIPLTLSWTRLGELRTGQPVNLEMDVLVKAARTGRPAALFGTGIVAADHPSTAGPRVPSLGYILDRGFGRRGRS